MTASAAPDPALHDARALVQSLLNVLRELGPMPGLAEADRLGLSVLAEQLVETHGQLARQGALRAPQAEHLTRAADALAEAAHRLAPSPSPAQVSTWRLAMEPSVRAFGKAVFELPHR